MAKRAMYWALVGVGCWGTTGGPPDLGVAYDDSSQHILVTYARELEGDETLHARLRRGPIEDLDCARDAFEIDRIDMDRVSGRDRPTWWGPFADATMFESVYDTSWFLGEPTAEMLAEAAMGTYVIDVCLMDGETVVRGRAFDIRRALDQAGGDGKFDGEGEERIASTVAYAEACVAQMGEIPFFAKIGDGDYETYNCLDSIPVPTTVTDDSGNVSRPEQQVSQCDAPQYTYSICEPNAVDGRTNGPRLAARTNDQGTHWALLCRKAGQAEGTYNDIGMMGHNPYTGKTCYLVSALYSKTDGLHIPHPADKVSSPRSPQESATLWDGIHGGLGSGIECAACHTSDPFVHTPWIDQVLDSHGDPLVPKMGIDDDFVLGYNDTPYSIVNLTGQGWGMPQQLVSPEAAACTKCHRIDAGPQARWMSSWIDRLVGEDPSFASATTSAYRSFTHTFWMPPELDGLTAETWPSSDFGRAVRFIQGCRTNPSACQFAPLPTSPIGDDGELPTIDLEGPALARESLKILGAAISDPTCPGGSCASRRCAECHSVSKNGLRRWLELTDGALADCNLRKNASAMSQAEAKRAVDCMRASQMDDSSAFEAAKLGVLATGVQYTPFRRLFQKAYGDNWLLQYAPFQARVGMPKGSHPKLSQKEYATILKWFQEDLDDLDDVLLEAPAPSTCDEFIDASAITAHVSNMRLEGWGAQNAENGIRMFGCAPDVTDARTCLMGYPDRTSQWGGNGSTLRELVQLSFRTSFWTRSSADGRYVGNGGGSSGATVTDLQANRDIGVRASYDPGFFPDNSGFIFQGWIRGAGFCAQSILANDTLIDFTEPQCMRAEGISLYQHVARGIHGGDYFVINSQYTSDSGHASSDPGAYFDANSTMKFTPMIFNGTTYEQLNSVIVDSPYEGDSVLSPSGQLVVSRLAGASGRSLGYVVRRLVATRFGSSYTFNIDQRLATVCFSGAKPNVSFDERFLVTHHYTSGKSDIYLVDLQTGQRHQITNAPSGTYAMFPHFRSDNWIYFLVSSGGSQRIGASDAALGL